MFKRVYIEVSNVCDLQCSFCPSIKREKKFMSVPDFDKILGQVAPLTEEVCLHLMGEPFTHPKIEDILKVCADHNTKVQLTSNGLHIDKFQNLTLDSTQIRQINFSIQSFTDNFPNKNIDEYLFKILNFVVKATKLRPDLYINLRLWNIDDVTGKKAHENETVISYVEGFFKTKINRHIDVGYMKSKKVCDKLYLHFDSRFEWPSLELPYIGDKGTCHGMSGHIGILVDGTVVPCCLDKDAVISLGNCLEQNIVSILGEQRAVKIKEGFAKGTLVEELCRHCSYIQRFSQK